MFSRGSAVLRMNNRQAEGSLFHDLGDGGLRVHVWQAKHLHAGKLENCATADRLLRLGLC